MKERLPVGSLVVTAIVSFCMGAFLVLITSNSGKMLAPQLPFYKAQYPTPLYFGNVYLEVPPGWEVRNPGPNTVEIVSRRGSVLILDFVSGDKPALAKKRLADEDTPLILERNKSGNSIFSHTVEKGNKWIFEGYVYIRSSVTSFKGVARPDDFEELSQMQQILVGSRETV